MESGRSVEMVCGKRVPSRNWEKQRCLCRFHSWPARLISDIPRCCLTHRQCLRPIQLCIPDYRSSYCDFDQTSSIGDLVLAFNDLGTRNDNATCWLVSSSFILSSAFRRALLGSPLRRVISRIFERFYWKLNIQFLIQLKGIEENFVFWD